MLTEIFILDKKRQKQLSLSPDGRWFLSRFYPRPPPSWRLFYIFYCRELKIDAGNKCQKCTICPDTEKVQFSLISKMCYSY